MKFWLLLLIPIFDVIWMFLVCKVFPIKYLPAIWICAFLHLLHLYLLYGFLSHAIYILYMIFSLVVFGVVLKSFVELPQEVLGTDEELERFLESFIEETKDAIEEIKLNPNELWRLDLTKEDPLDVLIEARMFLKHKKWLFRLKGGEFLQVQYLKVALNEIKKGCLVIINFMAVWVPKFFVPVENSVKKISNRVKKKDDSLDLEVKKLKGALRRIFFLILVKVAKLFLRMIEHILELLRIIFQGLFS